MLRHVYVRGISIVYCQDNFRKSIVCYFGITLLMSFKMTHMFRPVDELASSRTVKGRFANFLPNSQTVCPIRKLETSSRTGHFCRTQHIFPVKCLSKRAL